MIRIGFGGPLYYNYKEPPPKNSIGNFFGPLYYFLNCGWHSRTLNACPLFSWNTAAGWDCWASRCILRMAHRRPNPEPQNLHPKPRHNLRSPGLGRWLQLLPPSIEKSVYCWYDEEGSLTGEWGLRGGGGGGGVYYYRVDMQGLTTRAGQFCRLSSH